MKQVYEPVWPNVYGGTSGKCWFSQDHFITNWEFYRCEEWVGSREKQLFSGSGCLTARGGGTERSHPPPLCGCLATQLVTQGLRRTVRSGRGLN